MFNIKENEKNYNSETSFSNPEVETDLSNSARTSKPKTQEMRFDNTSQLPQEAPTLDFFKNKVLNQIINTYGHLSGLTNFECDGRTYFRFSVKPEKPDDTSGWLIASTIINAKKTYYIATYGVWGDGEGSGTKHTVKSWSDEQHKKFTTQLKNKISGSFKKIDRESEKKHKNTYKQASSDSIKIWDSSNPIIEKHPYLEAKGLNNKYGNIKLSTNPNYKDDLIIPIVDENFRLTSLEFIKKDTEQEGKFKKSLLKGGKVKGCFVPIGIELETIKSNQPILVTEGYATGQSCHLATNLPVIAARNCGNILAVIENIKKINDKANIIICTDNDKNQAGLKAAEAAKNKLANILFKIKIITPQAKKAEDQDSIKDFNDLMVKYGLEEVKEQIQKGFQTKDNNKFVRCIGQKGDSYVYVSSDVTTPLLIKNGSHNRSNFISLIDEEFWFEQYPQFITLDKHGNPFLNWGKIENELKKEGRKSGDFIDQNVKGRGLFVEKHKKRGPIIVINDGKNLWINGEKHHIFTKEKITKNFYQSCESVELDMSQGLTSQDLNEIDFVISSFMFQEKESSIPLLLGGVISSVIMNLMPWRNHFFIRADKGAGKSTLLEVLAKLVPFKIESTLSTAAGIRQRNGKSAQTIFLDETESDEGDAERNMRQLRQLMRNCSTNDGKESHRGTADGKGTSHSTDMTFFTAATNYPILNGADETRITIIEMEINKSITQEKIQKIKDIISKWETNGIADRFFTTVYQEREKIDQTIKQAKKELETKLDPRLRDQYCTTLGAYFTIFRSNQGTQTLSNFINSLNLQETSHFQKEDTDIPSRLLKTILEHKVDNKEGKTVSQLIKEFQKADTEYDNTKKEHFKLKREEIAQKLEVIGLRILILDGNVELHISNDDNLKKIFKANNYHSKHLPALRNHKDVTDKSKVVKKLFSDGVSRGLTIYLYNIEEENNLLEIDRRLKDKKITPSTRIIERKDDFDENLVIREVIRDGHQETLYHPPTI